MPDPRSSGYGRSRFAFLSALVSLLALAALVGWVLVGRERRLTMAISSWPGYEYFYLAERRNLDHAQGLDLRVRQYTSLEDQRMAYGRGEVDVIATTLPETIAICQETPNRCPQVVLVLDESAGADVLIAISDFAGVGALVGRRVGMERTVLAEYLLMRALEVEGLSLAQLRLKYQGPASLVAALRKGKLDAIVTYPPHDDGLRGDQRYRVLFSSQSIPGEIVDVLAVDPTYARRYPHQLRALVRSWWSAHALARAEPAAAKALMAKREQVSPEAFAASERWIRYSGPSDQLRLLATDGPVAKALTRMVAQLLAAELIDPQAPLPRLNTAFLSER